MSIISIKHIFRFFYGEVHEPSKEEYMRDKEYRPTCLLSIGGILLGMGITCVVQRVFKPETPLNVLLLGMLPFQGLGMLLCLTSLLPMARRCGFRQALDFPREPERFLTMLIACIKLLVLVYPSVIAVNIVFGYICKYLGIPQQPQSLELLVKDSQPPIFWICAAASAIILAPVAEELIVRLALFRFLRYRYPLIATSLASLIFAMMHGNAQYFAGLYVVGLWLQHARAQGGIPRSIMLHSIYNLITFIAIAISATKFQIQ